MPIELVPITIPAMLVVAVAVRLARQGTGAEEQVDTVLDLRDVPTVQLGSSSRAAAPSLALTGALVAPDGSGSLGARLRSVEPMVFPPVQSVVVDHPVATRGRVVVGRRRRQPLVAQR